MRLLPPVQRDILCGIGAYNTLVMELQCKDTHGQKSPALQLYVAKKQGAVKSVNLGAMKRMIGLVYAYGTSPYPT